MNARSYRVAVTAGSLTLVLAVAGAAAQEKVRVTRDSPAPREVSRGGEQRGASSRTTGRSAGSSIRHADRQQPRRTVERRETGRDSRVIERDRRGIDRGDRVVIDRGDPWSDRSDYARQRSSRLRYGTVVRRPIATEYKRISYGGREYYRDRYNNFYLSISIGSEPQYQVCRPPVGIRIEHLPEYVETVVIGGTTYYYDDDVYYAREYDDGREVYVAIEPPIGATIYELPPAYETVVIRDARYYRVGASYYRPYYRGDRLAFLRVSLSF